MTQNSHPSAPILPPTQADPLAQLHKMSRTAGVGTQDYVAINPLAVTALVLGIASGIVVFGRLFFVVPLTAIVFGLVALHQIRNSNGTQSGRIIAALGMVLAIGLMGYQLTLEAASAVQGRDDRQQLSALVETLGAHVVAGEYDQAYALFSERFRQRVNRERFDALWDLLRNHEVVGSLQSMQSTGLFAFETDRETQTRYAVGMSILRFSKTEDRQQLSFRRDPRQGWQIDDIPSYFPPQR